MERNIAALQKRTSLYTCTIISILLSLCLSLSPFAVPHAIAVEQNGDISDLEIAPIKNQLVEVVTSSRDADGGIAIRNEELVSHINAASDKRLPFGEPTEIEGVYSVPSDAKDASFILYSFGAQPDISIYDGDKRLQVNIDYEILYANNLNVTDKNMPARATVKGIGKYQGEKSIEFDIVGYRAIMQLPPGQANMQEVDGYCYNWGSTLTWPTKSACASTTSVDSILGRPIVRNSNGTFVALYIKRSSSDSLAYSIDFPDAFDLHPGSTLVDDPLKPFGVPTDTVSAYYPGGLNRTGYSGIDEWELQNAHVGWKKAEAKEYSLEDLLMTSVYDPNHFDTVDLNQNWVIYRGEDLTTQMLTEYAKKIMVQVSIGEGSYFAGSSAAARSLLNIEQTGFGEGVIETSGGNPLTAKITSGLIIAPSYRVTDNGLLSLVERAIADGLIEEGASVSYEPFVLAPTINVMIKPYDLSNDTDKTIWRQEEGTYYFSQIRNPPNCKTIEDIPHGTTLALCGETENVRVRLTNDGVDLMEIATLTPTGFGANIAYNILDDDFAFDRTATSLTLKYRLSSKTTWTNGILASGRRPAKITASGEYQMCVTGGYTTKLNYKPYSGESDVLTFDVVAAETDASKLLEAIDAAKSAIESSADAVVIDDSDDVVPSIADQIKALPDGTNYLYQSDVAKIEEALASAKRAYWDADSSQEIINAQESNLKEVTASYSTSAEGKLVKVDFDKLQTTVSELRATVNVDDDNLHISEDGITDDKGYALQPKDKYISAANKAKIDDLLGSAEALLERTNPMPSQKEVDAAYTLLETERVALIRIVGVATASDFAALDALLDSAKKTQGKYDAENAPVKLETADIPNTPHGTSYILMSDYESLSKAIDDAEKIVLKRPDDGIEYAEDVTKTEMDAVQKALSEATNALVNSKTVVVSKTDLEKAISSAATVKSGVIVAEYEEGATPGSKWVTQESMNALNNKTDDAESIKLNDKATQAAVDSATAALNDAIETFKNAIKNAPAAQPQPVSLLSNVAYTGVNNLEATTTSQTFTVAPTVKLKDGTKLTAGTDYTATLKDNGGKSFEGTVTEGGRYSFTISGDTSSEPASNNQIIYTFTVTGIGSYKDTDSTTFTLTLPKAQEVVKGLSLASSADEQNRVRVTAFIDGELATITRATSSDVKIAQANMQNNGASALVAGLTPGVATITVTAKDANGTEYTQTMMYVSTTYAGGQAVETKKVTNNAHGVELDGLPADLNDDLRVEVVKGDATGKSSMVNGGGEEKSLGLFDVVLKYQDKEVQPLGKINVTFAVDGVDSVGDNMKVVAYHWHGDTTTPKVYDAAFSRAGNQSFVTVPVAELSVFEPAYVKRTTATDENPGDTGTEKPPASGDEDNSNKDDGTGGGNDQDGNSGDDDGNGGSTPDKDLAGGSIVGLKTSYDYTGATIPIEFSMVLGSKTLTANTDYTYALTYSNGTSSTYSEVSVVKDAGMYRLTLTGKGDYTGTKSASFAVKSSGSGTGTGTGPNGSGSTGTNGTTGTAGLNGTNSGTGSTSTTGATAAGTGAGTTSKAGTSLVQTGDTLAMILLLVLVGAAIAAGAIRQARGYERRKKR